MNEIIVKRKYTQNLVSLAKRPIDMKIQNNSTTAEMKHIFLNGSNETFYKLYLYS